MTRKVAWSQRGYCLLIKGLIAVSPALILAMLVRPDLAFADSITTWSVNVYVSASPGGNANQGYLPIGGSESYGSNYTISNIPAGSQLNNSGGNGATFDSLPSLPGLTSATLGITSQNTTNPSGTTIADANAYGNLGTGSIGVSTSTNIEGVDGGNATAEVWMADLLTFNIPGATASTVTDIGVQWMVQGGGLSSGENGESSMVGELLFTGGLGSPEAEASTGWSSVNGVLSNSSGGATTGTIGFLNPTVVADTVNSVIIDATVQFTGPNSTLPLELYLVCGSSNDASCNFIDTESVDFALPQGVTFTSSSGVFETQTGVPEPSTLEMLVAGFCLLIAGGIQRHWRTVRYEP